MFSRTDLTTELAGFLAYSPAFAGGIYVACGDVNNDGTPDIVTAADAGGGPHVRVFSGANPAVELFGFFAYNPAFLGGVRVAVGDVNGDGRADIVTAAGPGGGPHVQAFSGLDLSMIASFFAYNPAFTGGVFVAAGNVTGGAAAEIITAADAGGGPHLRVFTGTGADTGVEFFAYGSTFTGGVRIGVGNVDGAGLADIVTGPGGGGGPHIRAFGGNGAPLGTEFFAY